MESYPIICQYLFCKSILVLSIVTLSTPLMPYQPDDKSFSTKIKADTCPSPVKNYFDSSTSISKFCDFSASLPYYSDDQPLFCNGLFDLHSSLCAVLASTNNSFGDSPTNSLVVSQTENVADFCKKWKTQSEEGLTSELFNQHSFSVITKKCRRVCGTLDEEEKVNQMCPLLLRGSQILLEMRKPSQESDSRKESISKSVSSVGEIPSGANNKNVNQGNLEAKEAKPSNTASIPTAVGTSENVGELSPIKDEVIETPDNLEEASKKLNEGSEFKEPPPSSTKDDVEKTSPNKEISSKPQDSSPKRTDMDPLLTAVNGPPIEELNPGIDPERQNPLPLEEIDNEGKVELLNRTPEGDRKNPLGRPDINNGNVQHDNKLEDPNLNPSKAKTDIQDPNYEDDEDINNQNSVAELLSSKKEFPESDVFVEAEDSKFFQCFMIISAAFILGYVAIVNKKKLIALIVEGRRSSTKRRHHSASYSKLDSNLEEALSSNHTAVFSSQVLY
nr:PREDICTED: trans-Golgi network integral membrane protein 2-like isoform X1 [Bemisia tabaci]XP_018913881.1 PREDICTED: trans-Golgi network integral membrane protein 2-like isoform X1 [Bemisia tabaci]